MRKRALILTGIIKREGNQYTALCLELDVSSFGGTLEKAITALRDAVETYVQYMLEEGREDATMRPVPISALREFLMGTTTPSKKSHPAFRAIPLEYSYA
ncbi:MAG: hypothetical protein HY782_04900 [Chloroflexi bacterium]|nr:hypothetical protein [Chloroflexota bacterium]